MQYFAQVTDLFAPVFSTVLPFLFVLTVVVFFHELGHFLVARWCGVKVTDFSIGFGPEIVGFNDRYGTRWRIALLPLGGYVKFVDDENAASVADPEAMEKLSEEDRKGSFHSKPLGQRAAVVAAGPIANFILAITIFAAVFTIYGEQVTEPRIDGIIADSVADKAGFKENDVILSIDDDAIDSFNDMQRLVSTSAGSELAFLIRRGSDELVIRATPEKKEVEDGFGNKVSIGVLGVKRDAGKEGWVLRRYDPISAIGKGASETWFIVERTMSYIGAIVVGRESADQLGGPLRIAQVSGQAASIGFMSLVNLIAVISVSIGLINLFPIPMLDGGHLLFYAIEAVKGEPLSESFREYGFRIGLAFVLMLMIFATMNDLLHFKVL